MTGTIIIVIVAAVTVLDIVVIGTIVRWGWGPLPREFPAKEPRHDAVWRRYQSFRLGLLNFGFCIHVAVDERHLHMVPIKPLRACGGRPTSIPWDAIRIEKRSARGKWITTRVGKHTLTGPSWCLDLAQLS